MVKREREIIHEALQVARRKISSVAADLFGATKLGWSVSHDQLEKWLAYLREAQRQLDRIYKVVKASREATQVYQRQLDQI